LFYLFLTLASFWLSIHIILIILNYVFFWNFKSLSALCACFVGIVSHATLFFFFLSILSILVWILGLYLLSFSVISSINFFLGGKNCFFYRLWAFDIFKFVRSLAGNVSNVDWWSIRVGILFWRSCRKLTWPFGAHGAISLEVTVSYGSSISLSELSSCFFFM
jgi:hypothetical protein